MTRPTPEEDLMRLLASADPVPPDVVRAAEASFTWLGVDAELVELLEDSALTGAAVRGADATRMLTFVSGDLSVMVEVAPHGDRRVLNGRIRGVPTTSVEIRHPRGGVTVPVESGRFRAADLPSGPMSLRLVDAAQAGSSRLVTDWVSI